MKSFFCVLSLDLKMLHRQALFLQFTMDMNVHHKEVSGDLINVDKNGQLFFFQNNYCLSFF